MATNKENGKRYIGVTCQTLRARIFAHFSEAKRASNRIFLNALKKYGKDAFSWKVLGEYKDYKDALCGEVYFIEEIKPEYNMTMGGEGALGFIWRDESRKKISEANKKRIFIGKKHGLETIEKMRLNAKKEERISLWKKYTHLGPESLRKKVFCLSDFLMFDSASAAARHYSISKSAIIEHCNGYIRKGDKSPLRKTVGGKVFTYCDEKLQMMVS